VNDPTPFTEYPSSDSSPISVINAVRAKTGRKRGKGGAQSQCEEKQMNLTVSSRNLGAVVDTESLSLRMPRRAASERGMRLCVYAFMVGAYFP
jgi:hypothetical protein